MRNEHEEHLAADELLRGVKGVYSEAGIQSLENRDHYYCERIGDGLTPLVWDQQIVCPESVGVISLRELEKQAKLTKGQRKCVRAICRIGDDAQKVAAHLGKSVNAVYVLRSRAAQRIRQAYTERPMECSLIARLMDREEDLPSSFAFQLFWFCTARWVHKSRATHGKRRTAYRGPSHRLGNGERRRKNRRK